MDPQLVVDEAMDRLMAGMYASESPSSNTREVVDLDEQIERLTWTSELVLDKFRVRIADARKHRNAFVPIHRLPTEITVTILHFVADKTLRNSGHIYYETIRALCGVSRLWRTLILNTPSFWTVIASDMTPHLVSVAMKRSKNTPLTVSIFDGPDHKSFVEAIIPQAHRWWRLNYNLQDIDIPTAVNLVERVTPLLEDAQILFPIRGNRIPSMVLFNATAPRLRRLSVSSVPITWETNLLQGLLLLHLNDMPQIRLDFLIEILAQNLDLIDLTIESMFIDVALTTPETPIILENLRVIRLEWLTSVATHDILVALRFPNCDSITLKCSMGDIPPETLFNDSIRHIYPVISKALLNRGPNIDIRLTRHRAILRDLMDGPDFRVEVRGLSPSKILRWLLDGTYATLETCRVYLQIYDPVAPVLPQIQPRDIIDLLDRLPATTKLHVELGDSITPVIQYLTQPQRIGGSSAGHIEWPLPRLQTLSVGQSRFDSKEVVKMVRCRYGLEKVKLGGKGKRKKPDIHLPAKFQALLFTGAQSMAYRDYEELERIVGKQHLFWDLGAEEEESEAEFSGEEEEGSDGVMNDS